jgi:hypothetical protein
LASDKAHLARSARNPTSVAWLSFPAADLGAETGGNGYMLPVNKQAFDDLREGRINSLAKRSRS